MTVADTDSRVLFTFPLRFLGIEHAQQLQQSPLVRLNYTSTGRIYSKQDLFIPFAISIGAKTTQRITRVRNTPVSLCPVS